MKQAFDNKWPTPGKIVSILVSLCFKNVDLCVFVETAPNTIKTNKLFSEKQIIQNNVIWQKCWRKNCSKFS